MGNLLVVGLMCIFLNILGASSENTGDNEAEEEDEDEDEWLFDQILPQNEQVTLLQNSSKYGFGNLTSGVFQQVKVSN